jgi:ribosomal protein S18 acetylase RimI-like enzyme
MTQISLCTTEDAARLLPLVARMHAERGLATSDESREAALAPLLEGSPLGAVWIFGPARAPVGYVVVTFGWSLETGGMDATVNEIWVRPSVRRRGIASEALYEIGRALKAANVTALRLVIDSDDAASAGLCRTAGLTPRPKAVVLSRSL